MAEGLKISVIVPVYNAEDYLCECIESILSQSYTDFELILVDDGSTDSSSIICDEYSVKDKRVFTCHGDNKGVSAARKIGFEQSTGAYICFVDADDTISADYLETLVGSSYCFDVVCSGCQSEVLSGELFANRLLCNTMKWFLHGNLYKRDVFRNGVLAVPREYYIGEDLIVNLRLSQNVRNVKCISYEGYNYRFNESSITHSCNVNLEYEEKFIEMVGESLGELSNQCYDAYWAFKLRYIRTMILTQKPLKLSNHWVQETLKYRGNVAIGWGDRIVLYSPNIKICYALLKIHNYLANKIVSHIKK